MSTEQPEMLPTGRGKTFRHSLVFSVGFTVFMTVLDLVWVGFSAVALGGGTSGSPETVVALSVVAMICVFAGMMILVAMGLRTRSAICGDRVRAQAVVGARQRVSWCGLVAFIVGLIFLAMGFALSAKAAGAISAGALFVVAIFAFHSRFLLKGVIDSVSPSR